MQIRVALPSQLDSYTEGAREFVLALPAEATLKDLMRALDARHPGVAFRLVDEQGRIRRHIAVFVGEHLQRELSAPLTDGARVQVVGALSGG